MKQNSEGKIVIAGLFGFALWLYVGLPFYYQPVTAASKECAREVLGVCLVVPSESNRGIFGFSEFVTGFALLVLIFTVTGTRYQFRVQTAPIPLWGLTYWSAGAIGIVALASDLWFSEHYLTPYLLSSQAYWQFALGLMFLGVGLIWLWYAYISVPKYGRSNALRFIRAVYRYVMQGAEDDLAIIADELERSAKRIVDFALTPAPRDGRPKAEPLARDLLLILGNRRFCRHVAGKAPNFAIALFRAVSEAKRYGLPLSQFASGLSTEALLNKDSLLYHEEHGFYSGYFGYTRPFTNSIYGDYRLVEGLAANGGNSPLDVDLEVRWKFDSQQLEAYARAVLTTFKSALAAGAFYESSYALNRAFEVLQRGCSDIYRLAEQISEQERSDIGGRVSAVIGFIDDAIDAMEKSGIKRTKLRRHGRSYQHDEDYYDKIARLCFEVVGHAASLNTHDFEGWSIQYSSIWSRLWSFDQSQTRKIVLFKLRRLLYEEIKGVGTHPNYLNAKYLGYCLYMMGLSVGNKRQFRPDEYPLRKVVLDFSRRNYLRLVQRQHKVAAAVCIGTLTFDEANKRLVKTYREGLSLTAPTEALDLHDPPFT
jgi:hypothetical protein